MALKCSQSLPSRGQGRWQEGGRERPGWGREEGRVRAGPNLHPDQRERKFRRKESGRCPGSTPPRPPPWKGKIQKLGPGSPQQTRGKGPGKLCTQQACGEALTPPQGPLEVSPGLWTRLPAPQPSPHSAFRKGRAPLSVPRPGKAGRGKQRAPGRSCPPPALSWEYQENGYILPLPQEGQEAPRSSSPPAPSGSGSGG